MVERRRHEAMTSRLRLRGYDYSSPGVYFVTICTMDRTCLFGDVLGGSMELTPAGQVIESWWDSIPQRFPDVALDERVVMPNHVHGLVMIKRKPRSDSDDRSSSLSEVMRWFKSMSTRDYILGVRLEGWPEFSGKLWQERFYEHIVRNDAALDRIRNYIEANSSQWANDKENLDRTAL